MELERDAYDHLIRENRLSMKVQRSEFIGIAFPSSAESQFFEHLEELRKETHGATHHCWGFRIVENGDVHTRSSDDGEPSGTAGRPILQAIEDADLFDSAVVVVRYFGGVKLGTGGLARAYRDAARQVLEDAARGTRILYDRLECRPGFEAMNHVYRAVDPPNVVLAKETFDPEPRLVLDVRASIREDLMSTLEELRIPCELIG